VWRHLGFGLALGRYTHAEQGHETSLVRTDVMSKRHTAARQTGMREMTRQMTRQIGLWMAKHVKCSCKMSPVVWDVP